MGDGPDRALLTRAADEVGRRLRLRAETEFSPQRVAAMLEGLLREEARTGQNRGTP